MKLTVNGDSKQIEQTPVSIADLLRACSVEMPEMVSVQLNGAFVDRTLFGVTAVQDGDEVDFLYFMGGGGGAAAHQRSEMQESPQICAD